MPDNKIEPFHMPKNSIAIGKPDMHCIGVRSYDYTLIPCIGSAETFRDAKACAIKNTKDFLSKLKKLEENV